MRQFDTNKLLNYKHIFTAMNIWKNLNFFVFFGLQCAHQSFFFLSYCKNLCTFFVFFCLLCAHKSFFFPYCKNLCTFFVFFVYSVHIKSMYFFCIFFLFTACTSIIFFLPYCKSMYFLCFFCLQHAH